MNDKKCVIFGTGKYGREAFDLLKDNYSEILFSDNDESKWDKIFCGNRIMSPNVIPQFSNYDIIIAISKHYQSVGLQLLSMGCKRIKVFNPYIELNQGVRKYKLIDFKGKMNCNEISSNSIFQSVDTTFNAISGYNKRNNRVLIMAQHFPPCGVIGAQRPLKFAKYLRKFGYFPTVVTKGFSSISFPYDDSYIREIDDIEVIRIQEEPILEENLGVDGLQLFFDLWYSIVKSEQGIEKIKGFISKNGYLLPDLEVIWVIKCIKELGEQFDFTKFDIVYTTSAPYSTHILGFYLKKRYGLKWVMDYRDSWCLNEFAMKKYYSDRKNSCELEKELEIGLLKEADRVIGAAERMGYDFKKYVPSVNYITITNGYDEDDFARLKEVDNSYFSITYNGSITYDRNPVPLLNIVNELIDYGKIEKTDVKLSFNGYIQEMVLSELMKRDKYNIVLFNGYIEHLESLQIAYNSSIIVVYGDYDEGAYYTYTGKIFECLRFCKPILSFSSPFGLHYEMIEKQNRGITATFEDKDKVQDFILKHYDYWKKNGCTIRYEIDDYVRSFSREHLTEKLARVFDRIKIG